MKKVVKFFAIVTGFFAFMATSVQAQFVRDFGSDPATCQRNLSLYQQDYQQGRFNDAIVNWRKVWKDCPQSSANLALHGIAMYQNFINRELDQNKKMALVDTLMMLYEKGMELLPHRKGNLLTNMAQDMLKYADTPENQPKLMEILEATMEAEKEKTTALVYASYMKIVLDLYNSGRLSDEELIDDYTKVSDYISDAIRQTNNEELAKARDMIDDSFVNSSAAGCENLLLIYGAKYDDNKEDAEFLRKLTRMLVRKECTDSELFEKASEQQYALNPSSAAAYNMARLFMRKDNFDKAVEYFEDAINSETDPVDKASFNYQLGGIMLTKYQRYSEAKKYVLEAIRLRPDWGLPYILLANTYANGPKCGEDEFERQYVYWVIADKLTRAKAVDSDVSATVDPMIREFSRHFPKKEEAFFRNITEGATVTVGCWINESTRVRFN